MLKLARMISLLCLCVAFFTVAEAAPPYDSGSMLNRQQQPQPALPDRLPQKGADEGQTAPQGAGMKVLVKEFRFTGEVGGASGEELRDLVRDAEGKELSFSDLSQLAAKVTAYLREEKGYFLARAYLPRQDVTEGIVTIAVASGHMEGSVRVRVTGDSRICENVLEGIAEKAVHSDEALRLARIERAVLLMDDLPGISAKASVERGQAPGASQVNIDVSEEKLIDMNLNGDNFGDRYTGIDRGGARIALNDPSGFGDGVAFSVLAAEHMVEGVGDYSLPLGASGLTGALHYSYLTYSMEEELSALDMEGTAETVGTSLAYPLLRTRKASLWTNVGVDRLALEDKILGVVTGDRDLLVGRGGVTANLYDGFGGGGMTVASLGAYYGDTDLDAAEAYDAAGPKTEGSFTRAVYSAARLQHLLHRTALFLSARGQFSCDNLDSSQTFILGGPTGVRAYPVSEGMGDEGHLFTAEVRYDLPMPGIPFSTQVVGFLDTGVVRLHHDPWAGSITNATGKNTYPLSGCGVGINLDRAGVFGLRLSYAVPIGENDGRSPNGNNVDNKNNNSCFWLQGMIWF